MYENQQKTSPAFRLHGEISISKKTYLAAKTTMALGRDGEKVLWEDAEDMEPEPEDDLDLESDSESDSGSGSDGSGSAMMGIQLHGGGRKKAAALAKQQREQAAAHPPEHPREDHAPARGRGESGRGARGRGESGRRARGRGQSGCGARGRGQSGHGTKDRKEAERGARGRKEAGRGTRGRGTSRGRGLNGRGGQGPARGGVQKRAATSPNHPRQVQLTFAAMKCNHDAAQRAEAKKDLKWRRENGVGGHTIPKKSGF